MLGRVMLWFNKELVIAGPVRDGASGRSLGLDALRGLAIIGMVFSGVFPHEAPWPAWMFHAQVGPPDFKYLPQVPGITWVDLVFPFFLFSMGAAFPLALQRKLGSDKIFTDILKRGALLIFFALALRYTNPGFLKADLWINYLTGMGVFVSFFLVFMRIGAAEKKNVTWLRIAGFAIIAAAVFLHSRFTNLTFNPYRQDIIILVLANMAVFGALIWILTRENLLARFGVLAFFAGLWLTKNYENSLSHQLFNFHPSLNWFYQFSFLKYLNVVIPGTILGDRLLRARGEKFEPVLNSRKVFLLLLCVALVTINLYGLFARQLTFTWIASAALCLAGGILVSKYKYGREVVFKDLFYWGVCWLFLGLVFEPLQGGIKKDPSSFSFWFLTSGLAFFTYIVCEIISTYFRNNLIWDKIIDTGKNPMVAYVAASFLILPVLYFTQVYRVFDYLREENVYLGLVKPIVVTVIVVVITAYTSKRGWSWRT